MFFDLKILSPQLKGVLSLAWIAATRGRRHLTKNEIRQCNIVEMAEHLLEFIVRESNQPNQRFSLRLSVTLLNGMVDLNRAKAFMLQEDLIAFLTRVRTPSGLSVSVEISGLDIGMFETPTTPVTKVKRSKKKQGVDTSRKELTIKEILSEHETIIDSRAPQSRLDDITIREEISTVPQQYDEDKIFDFGPIGEEIDQEFLKDVFKSLAEKTPTEKIQQVKRKKDSDSSPSDNQPPQKIMVVAQIHAFEETEPSKTEQISVPAIREIQSTSEIHVVKEEITVVPEIEEVPTDVVPETQTRKRISFKETPKKEASGGRLPLKKKTTDLLLNFQRKRVIRIDRCKPYEFEEITSKLAVKSIDKITPMLGQLYMEIGEESDGPRVTDVDVARLTKTPSSAPSSLISLSLGAQPRSGTPEYLEVPSQAELETFRQRSSLQKTIEETMPPAADRAQMRVAAVEDVLLPKLSDYNIQPRVHEPLREIPFEVEVPSIEEPIQVISQEIPVTETHEKTIREDPFSRDSSKDVPTEVQRQRQIKILKIVKSHDPSEGELTLEDVCPVPINRNNIAATFGDLLVLCKGGYVNLVSAENSIELKHITKGPKAN